MWTSVDWPWFFSTLANASGESIAAQNQVRDAAHPAEPQSSRRRHGERLKARLAVLFDQLTTSADRILAEARRSDPSEWPEAAPIAPGPQSEWLKAGFSTAITVCFARLDHRGRRARGAAAAAN